MLVYVALIIILQCMLTEHIASSPLQTLSPGLVISDLIRYCEPAMYEPHTITQYHKRRKRHVDGNQPLRITFNAHGRNFNLVLKPDKSLFTEGVIFDTTSGRLDYDNNNVYVGSLDGDDNTLVHGVVTNKGLFDGTIETNTETFYIEPISRYKTNLTTHHNNKAVHSIIYKTSDVVKPNNYINCASQHLHNHISRKKKRRKRRWLEDDILNKLNEILKEQYSDKLYKYKISLPTLQDTQHKLNTQINTNFNSTNKNSKSKVIFQSNNIGNSINKPKLIPTTDNNCDNNNSTDINSTYRHFNKRAVIDPKKTTCMLYLQADHLFYQKYGTEEACIEVMTRHVQRVNSIYRITDFNQDGKSDNISFMIKRIKVHTSDAPKDPNYRFPGNYGVEKFLELFSEEDYDAFCLAYMFTYRDFEMGTLGLAWTGDLKNAGGVCEKNGHYRGSLKSLNTGIVTLLNYGKHVPPAVSHVTLAHEIGHNFGSPHDPETCTPGGEDGNYIMFARATSGDKRNNNKFSPCSLNSINPVLNAKARSHMGCFTEPQAAICGNGVVEVGEECDCGWEEDCRDSCCYPQRRYPPAGETPCRLTPNSICSPSQGPCCTSECKLRFGDKCRDDNGCRDSSYCDGSAPSCPPSVNKPNKTICNDEFVCFMGECTGSICLAYGLESCQCIPGPHEPQTKACELCCKLPGDDQPCISSFDWNEAPYDIPNMFSKPGTPCNDYNGYCDVFQKCREVDPSGPLATLRKLLLSEESLASFKRWVAEHWYAVVIIIAAVLAIIVLTAKLLGKHSDLKLKSITIIHSSTTETVRLPAEGEGGVTVHPQAVRNKLPLNRKVREKKLHTKVVSRRKKNKNVSKTTSQPVPPTAAAKTEQKESPKKDVRKKNYVREISEESKKSRRSEGRNHVQKINYHKQRSTESNKSVVVKKEGVEKSPETSNSATRSPSSKNTSISDDLPEVCVIPTQEEKQQTPIYENLPPALPPKKSKKKEETGKIITSRLKRSNRVTTEISSPTENKTISEAVKKEPKSPVRVSAKKNISTKPSPSKKRKKKEIIDYKNDMKAKELPVEDPLGKVQNWLTQSISMGKTSENLGIMTLTLPKSKSSPVGLLTEECEEKPINPPKIVHKNDQILQIPKITQQKRINKSKSAGNLRKAEEKTKKDDKVKLQVVYKPPFKFSVKLRNNKVLGAIGTKVVTDERNNVSHLARRAPRTALLVKKKSSSGNSPNDANPFIFPSGVVPVASYPNNPLQLPIYLTDGNEGNESNIHTVPSDLDVLLSESEFLFSDA